MQPKSYQQRPGFHEVVGRALIDVQFREELMDRERQAGALRSMGIDPTPETVKALNESLDALGRLAGQFGGPRAAT
jgi:hypothetical protein